MGLTASLDDADLVLTPGSRRSCLVQVHNTASVVDQVLLEVLGDAAAWAHLEPSHLNLLPGESGTAEVVFDPPRSATVAAGHVAFAVRAQSTEDPRGSAIEEGVVEVAAFTDLSIAISPRSSHGKRVGRHRLDVLNRGNAETTVRLSAADPDEAVDFRIHPESFVSPPGTSAAVKLRVEPQARFLRGPNRSLSFRVYALTDSGEPATADGVMLQRQMMPTWLMSAAAIATIAIVAVVALWLLVLKPQVHSAAINAVSQQTKLLATNAAKASSAAAAANSAASAAQSAAAGGGSAKTSGSAAPSPSGLAAPSPGTTPSDPTSGTPVAKSLALGVQAGKTGSTAYLLPPHLHTLSVSDFVVQNPDGDNGDLLIQAGNSTLMEFALSDVGYTSEHFIQALEFTAAQPLTVTVRCANTTVACAPAVLFSGVAH
jgi:hypothetical protein